MVALETISSFAFLHTAFHFFGIALALHAVMTIKRAQSAVAWSLALIGIPLVTIPVYLLFGRGHFYSYVSARTETLNKLKSSLPEKQSLKARAALEAIDKPTSEILADLEKINRSAFIAGNDARLLIDGEQTYSAMLEAIDDAKDYIIVQFYIVRDDDIGQCFQDKLIQRAAEGIDIYFLYDEMGCLRLGSTYLDRLEEGGVKVCSFNSARGPKNLLYMNFRNHRKILIIDGETGFVGGHNLGDEYLSRSKQFGFWRDTHMCLSGPAVKVLQKSFIEDWYWGAGSIPDVDWETKNEASDGKCILVAPTGPADSLNTAVMTILEIIHAARERLWIVSPYFVPERAIMKALQIAALRGVDVRIMLPAKADKMLVWLASFTFYEDALLSGVKLYSYEKGFLHQKVILLDDYLATIGTANLDNRSLSLNFEITMLVADKEFAASVADMLTQDFQNCREISLKDIEAKPFHFRLGARLARLFSPLL